VDVTRHAYGLENAFMAESGSGGRVVAFNAEYDALSGLGHACGRNLISVMSIGSFISVAEALQASGKPGRVRLIGTPSEEGLGGKVKLIAAGAYRDVDACLMCHPGPGIAPEGIAGDAYMPTMASHKFDVHLSSKNANAAIAPWDGVKALDAVVLAYNGISMLRQQMHPEDRIHGTIAQGGERPNRASLTCNLQSATLQSADALYKRATGCFDGAALQTECEVEFERYVVKLDDKRKRVDRRKLLGPIHMPTFGTTKV
jgi:amidohydrolase